MAAIAFAPVTPALRSLVARAGDYAAAQGHRTVKLEHLLLALTEDGDAAHLLETCAVDVSRLRTEIAQFLDHHDDRDPAGETVDPPPHGELVRAIQHAAAAARGRPVGPPVVLAAVVGEGTTTAASLLSVQGFSFQAAVTALQQIAARGRAQPRPAEPPPPVRAAPPPQPVPGTPVALRPMPAPVAEAVQQPAPGADELLDAARRRIEGARPPVQGVQPLPLYPPQPTGSASPVAPAPRADQVVERTYPPRPEAAVSALPPTVPPPYATTPTAVPQPQSPSHHQPLGHPVQAHPHHAPPRPQPAPPQPAQPPTHPASRPILHPAPPGDYARPPAPRLEQAHRRQQSAPAASAAGEPQHTRTLEIGRLIENVPRRANVGSTRTVEVRLRRAEIAGYTPQHAQRSNPDGRVIHAVCVRLRAPEGGVTIETLTPETAWLDASAGGLADEFATWRWRVAPTLRGRRKLVLGLTVRRVGEEGLTAETNLPEQVFTVNVGPDVRSIATWAGGIAAALATGFAAGLFGNAIISGTLGVIARLGAG
ncbi:MAG: Clp protease N-terminal domain-containing protein [Hyphomicrobiaceae bacterium]